MTMEVKILSREYIKPSSPHHPKTHKISLLDRFIAPIYTPVVLYYPVDKSSVLNHDFISNRSKILKHSLSEAISLYYPLAGKVKEDLSTDCNDDGVWYTVAEIERTSLSHYLARPDINEITKFLPDVIAENKEVSPGDPVALIQESRFACGGITIGVVVSHTVVDGTSMCAFIKTWAAMANRSRYHQQVVISPNYDAPLIFPPVDELPKEAFLLPELPRFYRQGKCALGRFVFDASAIARLKATAISSGLRNPSRVEVVSALICKRTMKAKLGIPKPSLITHAVSLRQKVVPALSESAFGNFAWIATAKVLADEDLEWSSLLGKMRGAIFRVDSDLVKRLQWGRDLFMLVKEIDGAAAAGFEGIFCGSWCNLGLYKVDFGWGRPWWVTNLSGFEMVKAGFTSMHLLMDTRDNNGIEAWVFMDEEEMHIIENDKELRAFASVDPSPLTLAKL